MLKMLWHTVCEFTGRRTVKNIYKTSDQTEGLYIMTNDTSAIEIVVFAGLTLKTDH